jgi:hypothetical protein
MRDDFDSKKHPTGDYAVGYARPPKSGQWQKGQSGNPKGRAPQRRSGDVGECMNNLLEKTRRVEIDGRMQVITNAEAVAYSQLQDAFQRKPGAARTVHRWQQEYKGRNSADETKGGWTIIDARPVFDEEEDRGWNKLAKENENLKRLVSELQGQPEVACGIRRLRSPGGSGEESP